MPSMQLECARVNDFMVIRVKGDLKISTLYCIVTLVRSYAQQGISGVVIDVSSEFNISAEVKRLKRKQLNYTSTIMLIIIGDRENTRRLRRILSRLIK